MQECRLAESTFDIAAAAGWYSAIAGLLAGFAVVAILLPLDHDSDVGDDESTGAMESVVIFTCAFFSLLILGVSYAILSGRTGEGPDRSIAAHEQLLNGSAFGLATLLLLFGLRSVLATYGRNRAVFRPARSVMLTMTAVLGPVVSLSLQFANAMDIEAYRASLAPNPDCGFGGLTSGIWISIAITVSALVAIFILALVRHRLPRTVGASQLIAKGVLGYTVAIVAWTSMVVPLLPRDVVAGAVFEHVTLIATGVATVLVAAAAWASRGSDDVAGEPEVAVSG
jgi:hypothetical protein